MWNERWVPPSHSHSLTYARARAHARTHQQASPHLHVCAVTFPGYSSRTLLLFALQPSCSKPSALIQLHRPTVQDDSEASPLEVQEIRRQMGVGEIPGSPCLPFFQHGKSSRQLANRNDTILFSDKRDRLACGVFLLRVLRHSMEQLRLGKRAYCGLQLAHPVAPPPLTRLRALTSLLVRSE